jgi:hypothetical protein
MQPANMKTILFGNPETVVGKAAFVSPSACEDRVRMDVSPACERTTA